MAAIELEKILDILMEHGELMHRTIQPHFTVDCRYVCQICGHDNQDASVCVCGDNAILNALFEAAKDGVVCRRCEELIASDIWDTGVAIASADKAAWAAEEAK